MTKRIMIVDDDREYTHLFRLMLERSGYDIIEVSKGADVFRRLMTESYDLVFLDYRMKDVKGDKICENIRSEEKLKDLPLVIVTAYRDHDPAFFKTMGANDVVYKPVDRNELVRIAEKYLKEK